MGKLDFALYDQLNITSEMTALERRATGTWHPALVAARRSGIVARGA